MEKIPVEFEHDGKIYRGTLDEVFGSGGTDIYHLMIDNYYCGQLRKPQDKWVFDPSKEAWLSEYAEYFGNIVTGWKTVNDSDL